jgi:hypothetical protein
MMTSPWRACWPGLLLVVALLSLLFSSSVWAQSKQPAQPEAPQSAPPATQQSQQAGQQPPSGTAAPGQTADDQKTGQAQTPPKPGQNNAPVSKDRLFYTLPNFLSVENAANVPPMTTGEKFKVITRSSFDPVQFLWYGAISAVGQAQNSESAYGQGWGAYGKRYATAMADGVIEGYMTSAVFPSVFKQDPRYFVLGRGTFWHRTSYALTRLIITRSDSGHAEFNVSEVFGAASAAAISTYGYHPSNDKTLSNAGSVWGTQIGYDALAIVVKEFWPDIRRKIRSKRAGGQD